MTPNHQVLFAWSWIFLGLVTGMGMGLMFHRDNWLGGYGTWKRRLARLGHIAFFGTGLLNLAMALTRTAFEVQGPSADAASAMLAVGAVAMSSVCFLSAWRKGLRHLFALPVGLLVGGTGVFVFALIDLLL